MSEICPRPLTNHELLLRRTSCALRRRITLIKRHHRLIHEIPLGLDERQRAGHDDVHGSFGDVGDARRHREDEVEDGGVDREGFDAAAGWASERGFSGAVSAGDDMSF
jgi:hypothetical protein